MLPQVDFDTADSILRVLEGWELGNRGLYRKYRSYNKNHKNIKILFWSRESEKTIFTIFPEMFTRKIGNTGISSETTETQESRVRRRRLPLGRAPARSTSDSQEWLSHSRFPGFRRLTRDSWNRRLTRDSRIPDFFS